jgi:hypothetical protein
MDELAAAAKQDAVAYRRALLVTGRRSNQLSYTPAGAVGN